MTRNTLHTATRGLALAAVAGIALLGLACGQSTASEAAAPPTPEAAPSPAAPSPQRAAAPASAPTPTASPAAAPSPDELTFTGDRAETERFIRYYKEIPLTPEQERTKVEALAAIPAPCCANNPLATCCCPCNMAKAAWGMSAWLITEKGYGMEQVRQAARDWLAAAAPDGFTGDACYTGGCGRPIHENGCGGMDESQVL